MKKIILLVSFTYLFLFVQAQEFEGIERGDKELSFNGFLFTTIGTEYSSASGNFFVSYGSYITDKLVIGIAPGVSVSSSDGEITADLSGQVFLNFNFSSTKRSFPFIRLSYYQYSFDFETYEPLDLAYAQGGLGFKSFLTESLSWETTITYGLNLSTPEYGNLMLMTGITFVL